MRSSLAGLVLSEKVRGLWLEMVEYTESSTGNITAVNFHGADGDTSPLYNLGVFLPVNTGVAAEESVKALSGRLRNNRHDSE